MNRKRLFTLLVLLVSGNAALAQQNECGSFKEPLRNHVIIAFDEAGTKNWRSNDDDIRKYVNNLLFDDAAPLLGVNDYFSIVGVKADVSSEFWKDFVYIKTDYASGKELAFCEGDSLARIITCDASRWAEISKYQGKIKDESYSLLSVANSYILKKLGEVQDKPLVDRSYIIFVTDDRYNGDNYYGELQYFLDRPAYKNHGISVDSVLSVCYDVAKEYSIEFSKAMKSAPKEFLPNVELFEVKPNQDYLTLPAVVYYSPTLTAVRNRGGLYSIDLDMQHLNSHFDVKSITISLISESDSRQVGYKENLSECRDTFYFDGTEGITALRLEARLKINDGFYDATVISPATVGGVTQDIRIVCENDAEFFFDCFKLPDWLWLPFIKDQTIAANVLDGLIIVIGIVALLIYIFRFRTYVPDDRAIKMKKVTNN